MKVINAAEAIIRAGVDGRRIRAHPGDGHITHPGGAAITLVIETVDSTRSTIPHEASMTPTETMTPRRRVV